MLRVSGVEHRGPAPGRHALLLPAHRGLRPQVRGSAAAGARGGGEDDLSARQPPGGEREAGLHLPAPGVHHARSV